MMGNTSQWQGFKWVDLLVPLTGRYTLMNDWCLRRMITTGLSSVVLGVIVLSLLDCTESDRPSCVPGHTRTFSLGDSVYSVVEADTTVYVPIRRSCECDTAWVWATCAAGTATPGEDFVAATTRIPFSRGSAVESLAMHILADSAYEVTETILVMLGSASDAYEIVDPDTVEVHILDDEPPGPVFAFRHGHIDAFEGQGQVHVAVTCTGSTWGTAASVYARTLDGTARAGTDYIARSLRLAFIPDVTVGDFTIELMDDAVIELGKTFAIELYDPSHGGRVAPPGTMSVEILDDDTPMEPATIAMPLELGNQWNYDATVSSQGYGETQTVPAEVVGTLDERVPYQGEEYLRLRCVPTSSLVPPAEILLRQSGDSLLFICPADTGRAQIRETLPWLLADLSGVVDTTLTLFQEGVEPYWDDCTLRIFGREDTAVPAGRFRQTLRVRYDHLWWHEAAGGVPFSGDSWMEFTLADSVGFIRVAWGQDPLAGPQSVYSCDAVLVSRSPGK
jgi:hypothetical protein